MEFLKKLRMLNVNGLKFLAAVLMVIDHVGFMFFPNQLLFRYVGRLSMPLFAFAISEGCRYTKNKTRHFLLIFCLAVICQVVYYFFDNGSLYMCILVTFSVSILVIYAMQFFKKSLFENASIAKKLFAGGLFLGSIVGAFLLNRILTIDYGFWGCMTPVFASIFDFHRIPAPDKVKKLDILPLRALCLFLALALVAIDFLPSTLAFYALGALPLLLLYNGEKGKWSTKYFFYLFYPLHLVLLEGIYILLS